MNDERMREARQRDRRKLLADLEGEMVRSHARLAHYLSTGNTRAAAYLRADIEHYSAEIQRVRHDIEADRPGQPPVPPTERRYRR